MTDMLERYLQAIGQYLPEAQREDTLAELRTNLLEQMDARAEEAGRPLNKDEIAQILRGHGKPEVVALRYLPPQSLIGPTVFPFYKLTLVRVLPVVVLVSLVVRGIAFVASQRETPAHAIGSFGAGLAWTLLIAAGIITVIFAIIEWASQHGKLGSKWNKWDPMKLPPIKRHQATETPKAVAQKVLELVLHCIWMAYVLWVPSHLFWILGPGVFYLDWLHVAPAPVWHVFYELLIALLTMQLAMRLLVFVPSTGRRLRPIKLAVDAFGAVAIGWLAYASVYFVQEGSAADARQIAILNQATGVSIRIVLVIVLVSFGLDVYKYLRSVRLVRQLALHPGAGRV